MSTGTRHVLSCTLTVPSGDSEVRRVTAVAVLRAAVPRPCVPTYRAYASAASSAVWNTPRLKLEKRAVKRPYAGSHATPL